MCQRRDVVDTHISTGTMFQPFSEESLYEPAAEQQKID